MDALQHERTDHSLSAKRWTLRDMLALITLAALAVAIANAGAVAFAVCLFGTSVCFRIAAVDFSIIGHVANLLVLAFGIPMLLLAVAAMVR